MQSLNIIYNTVISQKTKERFEFILEPFQALVQLSCLAFCPIGSKITIYNNLLYIQTPSWTQGIVRLYYKDSKDDLYFLFNVISRYNKFYKFLRNSEIEEERNLYLLLIELSKKGIDNLLQTYQQSDKPSLLHTLQMYKTMLSKPNAFITNTENNQNNQNNSPTPSESGGEYSETDDREKLSIVCTEPNDNNKINERSSYEPYNETSVESHIDSIFIKINTLYSKEDLHIIYNTLLLIKNNPQNFVNYMEGLNNILEPLNNKIKKWINENIVF